MKILHIIGSMNPVSGGPCQGIRNLNKALYEKGIHREVVSMDDPKASFIGSDPFVIHALGPYKSSWQYSPKLFPWLIENLSRFDIVIVNGIWLYHVYAAIKALRILKNRKIEFNNNYSTIPRLFIMPHGMLDPYFQKATGRKLKALRNWIYWKLVEGKNIKEASGLLFTCEEELRLARQTFTPYLPKKEYNIGYGVEEPPAFSATMQQAFFKNCPGLKNRPFLLFLGRIHRKKGVDLLVKAYKVVYGQTNGVNREGFKTPALVIVGPGLETVYRQKIQHLIDELAISDSVFFPGMLSGNAKWGAFYCCESFILPSHQENFGIAIAEALACCKPVLISNKVNIWREIQNSNGGFVAEDTLQGIRDLLYRWANVTIEERDQMQKNARTCFELNFSVVPAARRLLRAISSSYQFINN